MIGSIPTVCIRHAILLAENRGRSDLSSGFLLRQERGVPLGRQIMRMWAAVLALLLAALPAAAQDYPTHPVTLIVPFPAGGGVDAVARIVAQKLSAALGQQVVIDNRGGAGGVIGTRAAVKAAPDGYTLVMAHTGTTSINPTLYANPGYDPRKDFTP